MHYLLIQQAIIDEIYKQAFADGRKALEETKFDGQKIMPALLAQQIKFDEIDKWLAYLAIEDYISLTADDHHRNPVYITLKRKGQQAEISRYFKEKYNDRRRENTKTYIQIFSQATLGVIGLLAFVITVGKSCTTHTTQNQPTHIITINNTIEQTRSFHYQDSLHDSLSKRKKAFK